MAPLCAAKAKPGVALQRKGEVKNRSGDARNYKAKRGQSIELPYKAKASNGKAKPSNGTAKPSNGTAEIAKEKRSIAEVMHSSA